MSALDIAAAFLGSPPAQDFIVLAGKRSPGLAVVRGGGDPRTWDIRAGYGLTGATIVYTGAGLATFEVDIFLWENAHWPAWDLFAKATLEQPAPVRNPTSLSIQHPVLNKAPLRINQVVVEDPGAFEQDDEGGLWRTTIKFIAYRKAVPVLVKPFEGPPGVKTNVAEDPELAEIREKAAIIKGLGG